MKTLLVVIATQEAVKEGDVFNPFELSEKYRIKSWEAPQKPGNTGRIYVKDPNGDFHVYNPATCGLEFINPRSVEPIPPVSV